MAFYTRETIREESHPHPMDAICRDLVKAGYVCIPDGERIIQIYVGARQYQFKCAGGNEYDYQVTNQQKERGSRCSHMGWYSGGRTGTGPDEHKFDFRVASERDENEMLGILRSAGVWTPGF
jgi:hypothetical protein